jgi:polygalacturonase
MNRTQPRLGSAMLVTPYASVLLFACSPFIAYADVVVEDTAALVAAVRDGDEGATVEIAAGTYKLDATLELKARMTLKGAGIDKTIITHSDRWKPSTKALPDPEMTLDGFGSNVIPKG